MSKTYVATGGDSSDEESGNAAAKRPKQKRKVRHSPPADAQQQHAAATRPEAQYVNEEDQLFSKVCVARVVAVAVTWHMTRTRTV